MKLQARETNYGTRVDYILATKGLLPWITHGDIQPSLKGSDHCPIYIDLRDEITLESGEILSLHEAMKQTPDLKEPPRIAARFWEEFSGKQTVLSSFFGKHAVSKQKGDMPPFSTPAPTPGSGADRATATSLPSPDAPTDTPVVASPVVTQSISSPPPPPPEPPKKLKPPQITRPSLSISSTQKRKSSENASSTKSKKLKQQTKGQASIASFFGKPSASSSSSHTKQSPQEVIEIEDDPPARTSTSEGDRDQLDADYRLALALAEDADRSPAPASSPSSSQAQPPSSSQNQAAWSNLFAPVPPPKCTVHNEPTRLYTVNKQGPNKGKTFYICARPVGPGYDKGKGERLRDEVDHRYRCNYFKWASEVRKEAMRERERERTK